MEEEGQEGRGMNCAPSSNHDSGCRNALVEDRVGVPAIHPAISGNNQGE